MRAQSISRGLDIDQSLELTLDATTVQGKLIKFCKEIERMLDIPIIIYRHEQ